MKPAPEKGLTKVLVMTIGAKATKCILGILQSLK
jgi:hypothetical protein